mmetsp:Transcript_979/g.2106  ORF Transcript_979/g.2106 Transcript_979/m.2106 type:complete len:198 (-) Transcript_979:257-850(-)|eukprot:CAMPEP_0172585562 /NCGR_PEP_ID=MMETSP1068-20121228/4976_1 /TAXON_ID=35684 /ORGANISM="Pseudopedinella elastica, Strain CCMP716" /LENGTH=197 /DNA_ID=CAMNT_0013380073 /DNA_START=79 /DNA_END=672 /DNA_ORIENTATION=-
MGRAVVIAFLLALAGASAFVPSTGAPGRHRARQVVMAEKSPQESLAAAALGLMLASGSVLAPLMAAPEPALAARSGGRAGGSRSFKSAAPPRAAASGAARTTVINRNYYPPSGGGGVMIAPVISPFGYGYGSPFGGMGTGYALGSMAASGNRAETYRLENQVEGEKDKVRDVEFELQMEKQKAAELERRLSALENKQ